MSVDVLVECSDRSSSSRRAATCAARRTDPDLHEAAVRHCAKAFDASRCSPLHLLIFPIFLSAFLSFRAPHPSIRWNRATRASYAH
jgi:hypothetical protein